MPPSCLSAGLLSYRRCNKTIKVSPLSASIYLHKLHTDMRTSYAVFVAHICTDVYFALLLSQFGRDQDKSLYFVEKLA